MPTCGFPILGGGSLEIGVGQVIEGHGIDRVKEIINARKKRLLNLLAMTYQEIVRISLIVGTPEKRTFWSS